MPPSTSGWLAAGASVTRPPKLEPWGLIEMWLQDPDGIAIVLVEVPADHPLRRDHGFELRVGVHGAMTHLLNAASGVSPDQGEDHHGRLPVL